MAEIDLMALGMHPQVFPAYDTLAPQQFLDNAGNPSGAAGSVIKASYRMDNWPRILLGFRIQNVWQMPEEPTEAEIRLCEYVSRVVDGQQTVSLEFTSNNITLRNPVPQTVLQGADGIVWHNFPIGYPSAGQQDITVEVVRQTSYPKIRGTTIVPKVVISLVSEILRTDASSIPSLRRGA